MFKKLLSNLPFNPSLIGQVAFYAQRLHRESSVRRTGVFLLAIGFFLQTFAVLSPPSASLQASPDNDLIVGGITSAKDAAANCTNNTNNYKYILQHYGITCTDVAAMKEISLKSTDYNNKLMSMGHLQRNKPGEQPVTIDIGGGRTITVWLRPLSSFDTGAYSTYRALQGKSKAGLTFFILFNCGNLVFIGVPPPPPPTDVCTNIAGVQTKPEQCDVCPLVTGIQTTLAACDLCPNISGIQTTAQCDVCPNKTGTQTTLSQCDVCTNIDGIQLNTSECDVCPDRAGVQSSENECKPCEAAQTSTDKTACLSFKKVARNVTQNIANADGTTARGGDTIEYTLLVTNSGKDNITNFIVQENISDILDYADVVTLNSGTLDNNKNLSWPAQTINAKSTVQHNFTVKIKNPIPSTPVSTSDPGHFDLQMVNIYGNSTTIHLPPTTIKTVEVTTQKLPNTGPGESLIIGFSVTMVASYFLARSRLLAKELDIVRTEFATTGGM